MLPGAAGPTSPLPITTLVPMPVMPPAIAAMMRVGFMSTNGKYTSWMPPKNCTMIAPGAVDRAAPTPRSV